MSKHELEQKTERISNQQGFVVDLDLLKNINNAIIVSSEFSKNEAKKISEVDKLQDFFMEPIKRFEFNTLVSLYDNSFKPYSTASFGVNQLVYYGKEHPDYFVEMPTSEVREILNGCTLVTLDTEKRKTKTIIKLKSAFRRFTDENYLVEGLYKKLFELVFDARIKTLYYFIYKNRYDFIDILKDSCPEIFNLIRFLDIYLYNCMKGYHKPLLRETVEAKKSQIIQK